jgi:hypothetical protein
MLILLGYMLRVNTHLQRTVKNLRWKHTEERLPGTMSTAVVVFDSLCSVETRWP